MLQIILLILVICINVTIGVIIIRTHKTKPIGTLTLNTGITDRPPFELRIYEDPNEIKSGELVAFELIVKE